MGPLQERGAKWVVLMEGVLFFQATRVSGLWGLFRALQQGAETAGPCLLHCGGANLVPVKHETWGDLNLAETNSENCLNKRLVRFPGKNDGMKGGLLCEKMISRLSRSLIGACSPMYIHTSCYVSIPVCGQVSPQLK